ncbi:RepB family protein [Mucilaginibacter sp. 10I4]|uniref:RepB family protein n=1 Tax=Mucilaginibacter sp. 10I4 TaxID=3048580 RepID=UPI002B22CA58|nr:RepB family protein [Mucilaginibacter sp. 10I4]
MAKKMISIKIEEALKPILEQICETESRSQGGQVEYWIKKEAERLSIKLPSPKP